jgi:protein O-mannosyl-transferase
MRTKLPLLMRAAGHPRLSESFPPAPDRTPWPALALALVVLGAVLSYLSSFSGVFVYDDAFAIVQNPTIRRVGSSLTVLPGGLPVSGRPLVNFSLALNYAWSGEAPWSYHAVNLAIHVLAALTLGGIVRRTLALPRYVARFGAGAGFVGAAAALLWAVHPLQTESVTYVAQRAESLAGLFYLLTLYAAIRGVGDTTHATRWKVLAWLACLCGMASKEVMVSAPFIVLLYDRTFVAGSFHAAWRERGRFYLGLAATWILLGYLVAQTGGRGGTAGFTTIATWSSYVLAQAAAIVRYLTLAIWPHPLVFDYGTEPFAGATVISLCAIAIAILLVFTAVGLWRGSPWGFLGAWFFALLAPSSSIVPVLSEIAAEHRMYSPLAAVLVAFTLGLHAVAARWVLIVALIPAIALGWVTSRRNQVYHSELALWADTVAKRPGNARAHFNLGNLLLAHGRVAESIAEFEAAVRIRPGFAAGHANLADAFFRAGRLPQAAAEAELALRLEPNLAEAHATLANVRFREGKVAAALPAYEEAVRLKSSDAVLRSNLGAALSQLGRLTEAAAQYEEAIRLNPASADANFFLANTLVRLGRFDAAIAHYEQALRLNSDFGPAKDNLARARALRAAAPRPAP